VDLKYFRKFQVMQKYVLDNLPGNQILVYILDSSSEAVQALLQYINQIKPLNHILTFG
jgi:hypothetical protein